MTFRHHLFYMVLRGPAFALSMQFASFVAIKSLGASEREAILTSLAVPIGNLLAFLWPRLLARRARIPFAAVLELLGFLILIPMFFVGNPWTFIALIFIALVLRSPTVVVLAGVARDNYEPETRGRTMGVVQSLSLGIMAVSGLLFGWILEADAGAYRYLYPITSILGLIGLFGFRRIPEPDPNLRAFRREPSLLDFFRVFKADRDFLHYQISFFLQGLAVWTCNALLPLYLAQDLNVNYEDAAFTLVVLIFGLPFLTSPFWGWLIDRFNVILLRALLNVAWALCPLLMFLHHSVAAVIIAQTLSGFIQGGGRLIWSLGVNVFARKDDVPTYMGIHQTLTGVRGIIGVLLGLKLAEWLAPEGAIPAYRSVFLISAIVMAVAGVYMFWESREMQRKGRATIASIAERAERDAST